MFVFTRNVFLYAFEKDFYSAAHSHNARFAPLWPAGHGSWSGGKRSTLVPCSVTRAQTDVTYALGRTRESPQGRSARCGAFITAHADAISWRARGHCLNRMEGKLGERESFEGKDRGLIPCSTMPCAPNGTRRANAGTFIPDFGNGISPKEQILVHSSVSHWDWSPSLPRAPGECLGSPRSPLP